VNAGGDLFLLRDQDRTLWNRELIEEGLRQLDASAEGDELTSYHLQAGIAAQHALASSYYATDWADITDQYDQLYQIDPNPVVALNRAIALSRWKGPEAGLEALASIEHHPALAHYHLLPATLGELWSELGQHAKAAECYKSALQCPCTEPERRLLEERLARADRR
jgi:RNA polymerase sigma-70 factor (ECF subfamily)